MINIDVKLRVCTNDGQQRFALIITLVTAYTYTCVVTAVPAREGCPARRGRGRGALAGRGLGAHAGQVEQRLGGPPLLAAAVRVLVAGTARDHQVGRRGQL